MVLAKNLPEKEPLDSKPNPIPNLTLTLPLTLHGGGEGFLAPIVVYHQKYFMHYSEILPNARTITYLIDMVACVNRLLKDKKLR